MSNTTIGLMLGTALALGTVNAPIAFAQSTLGGAKQQQNKIGGVAKPPSALGGAVVHTPPPPKPNPVIGTVKPASPGVTTTTTANAQGQTAHPTPLVTAPKKNGAVVTSNMKCAGGACTSVVPKP